MTRTVIAPVSSWLRITSSTSESASSSCSVPDSTLTSFLMDCQMPTMDGFEASRQIRQLSHPQPIIIAVTANALVGERERCLKAGMDDYLSKPFQAEQLIAVVKKWAKTPDA